MASNFTPPMAIYRNNSLPIPLTRGILSSLNVSKNSRTATSYYVKSLLKELPLEPQELAAELDILLEKGKGVYTSYRAAWREWSEKLKSNYKIDDVLNL